MSPIVRDFVSSDGEFAATRWTVVRAAGDSQLTEGHAWEALSELCCIYWRPLYIFLRRQGTSPEDAQDLTQGFFAHLIRDGSYRRADRQKGRFRSFLLGAFKHFVSDIRQGQRAQKRGGRLIRELYDDGVLAEVEAQVLAGQGRDPLAHYDREWAAALLRRTLERLSEECVVAGKTSIFDELRLHLAPDRDDDAAYEEISSRLHRSVGTLRSDMGRLRSRYRAILREEVRGTVTEPAEVDDELRYLCKVLAQS